MKLILLYGPPGVGKLTVSKELQKLTGYKLLHNHLVGDISSEIFDATHPARTELNLHIRTEVLKMAARHKIDGIISTFVYYDKGKHINQAIEFYKKCIDITKEVGGETYFIRLSCDLPELEKRVINPSRKGTKKINDVEKLRKVIEEELPCEELPEHIAKSLYIDNTNLKPEEVAKIIIDYHKL